MHKVGLFIFQILEILEEDWQTIDRQREDGDIERDK